MFELQGVPAAPVRTPADAVRDPRVLARGETVALEHPTLGHVADLIGPGLPSGFRAPPPARRALHPQSAKTTSWCTETGSATARIRSSGCAGPGIFDAHDGSKCR